MAIPIKSVSAGSPADGRILPGEALVRINGMEIHDVLDYMYYCTNRNLSIEVLTPAGKLRSVRVRKAEYDELGLNFETYLMDGQKSCKNHCIFCFVDQLPRGMRKTLYFKDDDARMSFLMGNYITMTNLTDEDINRLIRLKISPINISVQVTDDERRVMMMKNPNAAGCLARMQKFAAAGIRMNCQIVLCKGINDGAYLERSLQDLIALHPYVNSISVVPVGLTKYREKLYPLEPFSPCEARSVIEQVNQIGDAAKKKTGSRVVYLADEFYLKAGIPIPPDEYYEEYPQLENGVGMMRMMRVEFDAAFALLDESERERRCTIVTGRAAGEFIRGLVDELKTKWHNLSCDVVVVENEFFGPMITVTGLVVGQDILRALRGRELGEELIVPAQMLRYDRDRFLDDVLVTDLERELNTRVVIQELDGGEFIDTVLGIGD
ncbi:DUF512 domain-containing protein [Feifania hominis]|uniref:DUF512 domain-containing protein n=1 Tax=Feifania hominis TaxID=2763660 RepID=A0A926D9Y2_9FIRM|nr:DUF512 domain-containing protein [Feifania hominis]MBC8535105.1 DUF512 domain-containing protein [Feifania hominis]